MKKHLLITLIFGLMVVQLAAVVPSYYGARSLSLGYSGSAFNYDINSIFINPSLLSSFTYSMTGYQYQNSYLDYKDFNEHLDQVLEYNLSQFESLSATDKQAAFELLNDLFDSRSGMHGFNSSIPGFAGRSYGISVSLVKTAVINPVSPTDNAFFNKNYQDVTNDDIAALQMNVLGLSYKKISLAYSMPISRGLRLGIGLHYLNGKMTRFNVSMADDFFSAGSANKDYLEEGWGEADEKFSKIITDLSASMDIGRYFKVSLVSKNIGNPSIKSKSSDLEITMENRMIAGLAFRPNNSWGIYLDIDITKTDQLHNGEEVQPLSFGIEKGMFKNKLFLRAGFLNDLTEKHFFGSKANILYGLGLGFNMNKFVVDVAIGVNGSGSVKSLAVSGFILLR